MGPGVASYQVSSSLRAGPTEGPEGGIRGALSSRNSRSDRPGKLTQNKAERDRRGAGGLGAERSLYLGRGASWRKWHLTWALQWGWWAWAQHAAPSGHSPRLVTTKMTYSSKASGRVRAISAQISSTTSRATCGEGSVRLRWPGDLCPQAHPDPLRRDEDPRGPWEPASCRKGSTFRSLRDLGSELACLLFAV